jgi:hypothetical protein
MPFFQQNRQLAVVRSGPAAGRTEAPSALRVFVWAKYLQHQCTHAESFDAATSSPNVVNWTVAAWLPALAS